MVKTTHTENDSHAGWQRNLHVLWFGNFLAGVGFSSVGPFIALFIGTLGDYNAGETAFWSGMAFSAPFLVKAIVSPLWGRLADTHGRKLMLLRASLGMAIVIGAIGLVQNVYELVALRLLQGGFSGFISNANTLIATSAPREKSGRALGTLTTGNVSGTLLGPLIGGTIADVFGYRYTFFITGAALLAAFFLVLFLVQEHFKPISPAQMAAQGNTFTGLKHKRLIFGMFITTMIIQASNHSIEPILSLYVRQLMHGASHVALAAGIIEAINGLATLFAAPYFGNLGDRIGTHWILTYGLIFAMCVFIPMAFVTNIWQLGILRLLVGFSDAALIPSVQTLLAKYSPSEKMGRIFSWNQTFQATGNVLGPQLGSFVTKLAGYRGVFISTSLLVLLNFVLVRRNTAELKSSSQQHHQHLFHH